MKQKSVKKSAFHWMGSRHSVNEGTGKEFYRKGNSLKRFQLLQNQALAIDACQQLLDKKQKTLCSAHVITQKTLFAVNLLLLIVSSQTCKKSMTRNYIIGCTHFTMSIVIMSMKNSQCALSFAKSYNISHSFADSQHNHSRHPWTISPWISTEFCWKITAIFVSEGRKWGVRSVVVEFGVFGAPRFSVQRSQNPLKIGIWGPLDWKSGRPKNAKSYHDGSDPPFAALWLSETDQKTCFLKSQIRLRQNMVQMAQELTPVLEKKDEKIEQFKEETRQSHNNNLRACSASRWKTLPCTLSEYSYGGYRAPQTSAQSPTTQPYSMPPTQRQLVFGNVVYVSGAFHFSNLSLG